MTWNPIRQGASALGTIRQTVGHAADAAREGAERVATDAASSFERVSGRGIAALQGGASPLASPTLSGLDASSLSRVAGPIAERAGAAIDGYFLTRYPDLADDGRHEVIQPSTATDGGTGGEVEVYYVNGMSTDREGRLANAQATADETGQPVHLIHNSTTWFGGDLVEGAAELLFGYESPATQTLSDEMYANLTAEPPQKMKVVGYSQGSIVVALATAKTIQRLRDDGRSDEEIRGLMSDNVEIVMVGTPIDLSNPMQTCNNVPPGLAGVGGKRLDWFFTSEDTMVTGPPDDVREVGTVREEGPGERDEPNFRTIRHADDFVATWVHDLGIEDVLGLGGVPNPLEAGDLSGRDLSVDSWGEGSWGAPVVPPIVTSLIQPLVRSFLTYLGEDDVPGGMRSIATHNNYNEMYVDYVET